MVARWSDSADLGKACLGVDFSIDLCVSLGKIPSEVLGLSFMEWV